MHLHDDSTSVSDLLYVDSGTLVRLAGSAVFGSALAQTWPSVHLHLCQVARDAANGAKQNFGRKRAVQNALASSVAGEPESTMESPGVLQPQ